MTTCEIEDKLKLEASAEANRDDFQFNAMERHRSIEWTSAELRKERLV